MIVFIDRQHTGQPKRIEARGAAKDLDNSGKVETWETEAHWTGFLSIMLEAQLVAHPEIKVIPISDGSYLQRHTRVNEYSRMFPNVPQIYLAMHLNAGGGNYGSMFYHHQSSQGLALARAICTGLTSFLPEIPDFKAIKAQPGDWTKNAYYTIKGVGRPVAICSEPLFIDTHSNLVTVEGMAKVALGMSTGIISWMTDQ